jgi:hypothetical protein
VLTTVKGKSLRDGLRPPLTVVARSGEQKPFGPDKEMMAKRLKQRDWMINDRT